jgi:hypothetical protein
MKKEIFDEYINRFNQRDATAFDDYLDQNMRMQNGALVYYGVQGMKDHYAKIWSTFKEELHVERYTSDDENIAIEMWTHFTAERDNPDSLFGSVVKGDTFDYRGLIMYRVENQKFTDIKVSYLSFARTGSDGIQINMGIPH